MSGDRWRGSVDLDAADMTYLRHALAETYMRGEGKVPDGVARSEFHRRVVDRLFGSLRLTTGESLLEDPEGTDHPAFQAFLRHTKDKPHNHEHWEMFRSGWEALEARLNAEATEWWCNAW